MSRIDETFMKLKEREETALISYLTTGDPSIAQTEDYASALIEGGTDILELGIPFSDPIADGPVIQAASMRALQAGTRPVDVMRCAKTLSNCFDTPIALMSYYNSILSMGVSNFLKEARASGVDGLVVPDLPVDEAEDYRAVCLEEKVDSIFLATPTTPKQRLKQIVSSSRGFLYLVSVTGVTGERDSITSETLKTVSEFCRLANGAIPVAVGFGISKPNHVRDFRAQGADGVIVGSAFVRIVSGENGHGEDVGQQLFDATKKFKHAARSTRPFQNNKGPKGNCKTILSKRKIFGT